MRKKKRLKAKVRARICMILACLLLCGTGVSLWNGKRAEKSVSNIDTGQKSSKTVSNIDTGTENHQAVSNVDTDMETTKQVSNIDTDTEGMILKADPVDTADRNHICFFAVFFIGSWSVLMFLTAIRKKSKKDIGLSARRKDTSPRSLSRSSKIISVVTPPLPPCSSARATSEERCSPTADFRTTGWK